MRWHKKSPWNLKANETYEKYKPMISTLQDERVSSQKPKIRIAKFEAQKEDNSPYKQLMHTFLDPNFVVTR